MRAPSSTFSSFPFLVLALAAAAIGTGCSAGDASYDPASETWQPLIDAGVHFKTVGAGRFVGAQNGGGSTVIATATQAQGWENFSLDDVNGGALESGDTVFIQAQTGHYLMAQNGGGSTLSAASPNRQGWETFRVFKASGAGQVKNGDIVGIQSNNGSWLRAVNGGGGAIDVRGAAMRGWEQFAISGISASAPGDNLVWRTAQLTNYTSYPDPGSDECVNYNGCTWAGYFAGLSGKQPESWVQANNIAAVHGKDFEQYKLKTLRLRQGARTIDVKVYDMCADSDCSGCCTRNAQPSGFLIDIEKYTMQRFGSGSGQVEWACLDCN